MTKVKVINSDRKREIEFKVGEYFLFNGTLRMITEGEETGKVCVINPITGHMAYASTSRADLKRFYSTEKIEPISEVILEIVL